MSKDLIPAAGTVATRDFASQHIARTAELEVAGVQARERAMIEAEYLMAERHPRNWANIRAEMLEHCKRPKFAQIARYAKPVGKGPDPSGTGPWVEKFAFGWSARFAETLRQAMGNIKPVSQAVYNDEYTRIMRFGITDLEKNIPRSREVTFSKTVEKRGMKLKGEYVPPPGRHVVDERVNTNNETTYIVVATEDELRNKINSEESKVQRDLTLALCPRDILDECFETIGKVITEKINKDPLKAANEICDSMRTDHGVMPSQLETYIGRIVKQFTVGDIQVLNGLHSAIRDGQTTFAEALRARWEDADEAEGAARDLEQQRTMDAQAGSAGASTATAAKDAEPKQGETSKPAAGIDPPWADIATMRLAFNILLKQISELPDGKAAFYSLLAGEGSSDIDELVINHASSIASFRAIQSAIVDLTPEPEPAAADEAKPAAPTQKPATKPATRPIDLGGRK